MGFFPTEAVGSGSEPGGGGGGSGLFMGEVGGDFGEGSDRLGEVCQKRSAFI
jgi:hypothetical protein